MAQRTRAIRWPSPRRLIPAPGLRAAWFAHNLFGWSSGEPSIVTNHLSLAGGIRLNKETLELWIEEVLALDRERRPKRGGQLGLAWLVVGLLRPGKWPLGGHPRRGRC